MELKKLSASALNSAEMCLARWQAERDAGYGATMSTPYAMLGSSCHGAFEDFVKMFYIDKKGEPREEYLIAFYKKHFMENFATADVSGEWYNQGLELVKKWYARTDFSYFQVLSVETKEYLQVKTSIGEVPLTYVIDRLDQLGPHSYRVVDYKTSNELLNTDLLFKKIQAKIYGLAVQIKYPDAEEIWVCFDMLRFAPVQICLTREDNIKTWIQLKRAAERIIAQSEEKVPETLNPQCGWCIKKTTCDTVKRNVSVGGSLSYESLEEMLDARALLDFQRKAASDAVKELDTLILSEMERINEVEYETEFIEVKLAMSKNRKLDTDVAASIVGEDVFRTHGGGRSMTLSDFDKMVKDIGGQKAAELQREAITVEFGDPRVTIKPKGEFMK